ARLTNIPVATSHDPKAILLSLHLWLRAVSLNSAIIPTSLSFSAGDIPRPLRRMRPFLNQVYTSAPPTTTAAPIANPIHALGLNAESHASAIARANCLAPWYP